MDDQLTNQLLAFEDDHVWINENLETLLEQYANQWIAVKDGQVLASDPDLEGLISKLSGRLDSNHRLHSTVKATLNRNIESASGREEYFRIKLVHKGGTLSAEPVFGKSGLISILVESDGLVKVDMNTEGLYKGQEVDVQLFDS